MKVLIISGVPIRTDTNSGKTLQTIFSGFDRSELCQLYFSPETPNTNACSSYYQICEKQMIKSCFGLLKSRCGGVVKPTLEGENTQTPEKNALALTKNKRTIHMRLAREIIWSLTRWKNNKFKEWLKKENPDIIFAVMQDTNGSTKAIKWVAEKTGCKTILYITDDYYYDPEASSNLFRKTYFKKRQRLYQELSRYVSVLIGCSEKITRHFAKVLHIKGLAQTIFTPAADIFLNMPEHKQKNTEIVKIRYFGNLGLGRWQMLQKLGNAIKEINADGARAILEVYSSDTDPDTKKALTIENGSIYKGWVFGEQYLGLLQSADVAVHVESFDEENMKRTWGSISTKIADYLGAGKCIFAIGPSDHASIDHIKDVACTVSDPEDLKNALEKIIKDASNRTDLQERARALAKKERDIKQIQIQIRKIISESIEKSKMTL